MYLHLMQFSVTTLVIKISGTVLNSGVGLAQDVQRRKRRKPLPSQIVTSPARSIRHRGLARTGRRFAARRNPIPSEYESAHPAPLSAHRQLSAHGLAMFVADHSDELAHPIQVSPHPYGCARSAHATTICRDAGDPLLVSRIRSSPDETVYSVANFGLKGKPDKYNRGAAWVHKSAFRNCGDIGGLVKRRATVSPCDCRVDP